MNGRDLSVQSNLWSAFIPISFHLVASRKHAINEGQDRLADTGLARDKQTLLTHVDYQAWKHNALKDGVQIVNQ